MTSESLGVDVNVQLRSIDKITGSTEIIKGHNKITFDGISMLADYLSAHFNYNINDNRVIENQLIENLPYKVYIGTNSEILEQYRDKNVKNPILYPSESGELAGKPVAFYVSNGGSTMQSALIGSLQAYNVDGYKDGSTISYVSLSDSNTFKDFRSNSHGVFIDDNNQEVKIGELALMSENDRCWARIAFGKNKGLKLTKNRVYDILWNINLVSIDTQLKQVDS